MLYDPIRMRLWKKKPKNLLKTVEIYHAFACFNCIPSPFYDFCWASVLLFTMTLFSVPKGGVFHLCTLCAEPSSMYVRTENEIGNCVAGDFCQYWNLNSQITDDFDILIMVSRAKFQKILNGKTRFT